MSFLASRSLVLSKSFALKCPSLCQLKNIRHFCATKQAYSNEEISNYLANYSNIKGDFLKDMRSIWFRNKQTTECLTEKQLEGLVNNINAAKKFQYFPMNKHYFFDPIMIKLLTLDFKQLELIKKFQSQESYEIIVSIKESLIKKNKLSTKQIGVAVNIIDRMEYHQKNN